VTALPARSLRVGEVLECHPNPWSRPEMPMVMEGPVSDEDMERMAAETKAERAAWRPSAESWDLLDTLRAQVGCRVEDEGPFPIRAALRDVEAPLADDGFPMPVLLLDDVSVVPTAMGYDGRRHYLEGHEADGPQRFAVADLFSLTRLRATPRR
jgi:hypothetical protein